MTWSFLYRHRRAGPLEQVTREEDQHLHAHPACVPRLHDVSGSTWPGGGGQWTLETRDEAFVFSPQRHDI